MIESKVLYRTGEAARLVGVSHSTLKKYAREGRLQPTTVLGGHYFWSLERINEIRQGLGLPPVREPVQP